MTDTPATPDAEFNWAPCHCCGRSYPVTNMVHFSHHPGDHLCTVCIHWLYTQARPITRRLLSQRIPLRPRIQAWIQASKVRAKPAL
jgi:hypothetical protein